MVARFSGYLFPSLMVHGAFFAALAAMPATVESSSPVDAVEYIMITDDGGGRLGSDTEIGDAVEPASPPEKKFRKVKPKPKRSEPVVAKVEEPKPEPAKGFGEGAEVAVAATGQDGQLKPRLSFAMGSAGQYPNTVASGAGAGDEGVDRRTAMRAWLREIQREVNKIATRNYPSSAVRMKLEGRLKLGITIGADGSILGVRLLSSSGHSVLDDSATESVWALHIPAPPQELRWREREISLPVRYALQ